MKKLGIYLTLALSALMGAGFTSCGDDKEYPPVIIPEDYGSGAWDEPMSVSQVIEGATGNDLWVCGYIVGWIDTNVSNAYTAETARFTTPCTVAANMLMAADPDERDITKCLPVQLVSGSDARKALNLVDNPANLGKLVSIKANCERYFGTNGLKGTSNFNFGPEGVYEEPVLPAIYEASVKGGFEKWSFTDNTVEGGSIWKVDSKYGLVASGYFGGKRYDSDAWAITPEINLAGYTKIEFSFKQAANYFNTNANLQKYCSVAVREVGGEWNVVTVPGVSDVPVTQFTFVASGAIDLSAYAGKKIEIGFRYTSSAAANLAGTWEIDNVRVAGEK